MLLVSGLALAVSGLVLAVSGLVRYGMVESAEPAATELVEEEGVSC